MAYTCIWLSRTMAAGMQLSCFARSPRSAPEPTLACAGGQIWLDIADLYKQGDKVSLGTLISAMISYDRHTECRNADWMAGLTYRILRSAVKIWLKLRASDAARAATRNVRSDGIEAIQIDSWMTPISSVHHMAHASKAGHRELCANMLHISTAVE